MLSFYFNQKKKKQTNKNNDKNENENENKKKRKGKYEAAIKVEYWFNLICPGNNKQSRRI